MYLNDILEKTFSSPAKIRLLRFIASYGSEITGRQLAKFTGISHTQVQNLLEELGAEGLIISKSAGKAWIHSINLNNTLVKNVLLELFEKEKRFLSETIDKHLKPVYSRSLSVILFGSVKNGKEKANSDVDILVVTKNENDRKAVERVTSNASLEFLASTGNALSVLVLSVQKLRKMKQEGKGILKEIENGKVYYGKSLNEVLTGCCSSIVNSKLYLVK